MTLHFQRGGGGGGGSTYTADETTLHLAGAVFSIKVGYLAAIATTGAITDATGTLLVSHGGTGLATLTAHALYVGAGTSVPTAIGPGSTDGVPLVATGSSTDPAFRATALKIDSHYGAITADADNSTVTFDWSASGKHSVTLTASRTIAFSNEQVGQAVLIIFKSGGTGAFTPVWPATVKWSLGTAPTLTNVSGHWDLVSILKESSGNYVGSYSLNYY